MDGRRRETAKKTWLGSIPTHEGKLVSLICHFKEGGTIFSVTDEGNPAPASQEFARKLRNLTKDGKLDWVLLSQEATQSVSLRNDGTMEHFRGGGLLANTDHLPSIPEVWPHGFLSGAKLPSREITTDADPEIR